MTNYTLDQVLESHDLYNVTVVTACLTCASVTVTDDVEDAQRVIRLYDMTCCDPRTTVLLPLI